jgi:hypothetical protein
MEKLFFVNLQNGGFILDGVAFEKQIALFEKGRSHPKINFLYQKKNNCQEKKIKMVDKMAF